jgi:hypothetical protein
LEARIIAVCDAFDAMSRTRQYRRGMGRAMAVSILQEHSGSQWDMVVVEALVSMLRDDEVERPNIDDDGDENGDENDGVDAGPLAQVGRGHTTCDCAEDLPEPVKRRLADASA